MNKDAVREGFAGCFNTYSTEAVAQQQIAVKLAELMERHVKDDPKVAVEVGCGSGFLSEQLLRRYSSSEWTHNDITPSSEAFVNLISERYAATNTRFVVQDAEKMELPESINLFASSSAVQWFNDLDGYFARLAKSMADGGIVAISTFGPKNLTQIRDLTGNGLDYITLDRLREIAAKYFDICEMEQEEINIHFVQPVDVLRHIKLTGVNGAFRQCWTKGKLTAFNQGYEAFRTEAGYPLTYHPIYLVGKRL